MMDATPERPSAFDTVASLNGLRAAAGYQPETSRHSPPFAPARTTAASDLSHPSVPTPELPASLRQEHNQTMISESWFAIDSDDSPLRNRKITTVMLSAWCRSFKRSLDWRTTKTA